MTWALLILSAIATAKAHPLDMALLVISAPGPSVEARLELNPSAAKTFIHDNSVGKEIESRASELFSATLGTAKLTRGGQICTWDGAPRATVESEVVISISSTARCPTDAGALRLELPYLSSREATYRLIARAVIGGEEFVSGADPAKPFVEFTAQGSRHSFLDFVMMGLGHIGALPSEWKNEKGFHFPEGIDHLLFVLALMLCGGGFASLAKTITGFTVGHTVSLAAASFGLVSLPSKWVEAAIALTIAWIAFEGLAKRRGHGQWKATVVVGLIHGLGFATALSELHLHSKGLLFAVLGFNVGVELGQLVIVAFSLPALLMLWKTRVGTRFILPAMSICVLGLGLYWFVERAFF